MSSMKVKEPILSRGNSTPYFDVDDCILEGITTARTGKSILEFSDNGKPGLARVWDVKVLLEHAKFIARDGVVGIDLGDPDRVPLSRQIEEMPHVFTLGFGEKFRDIMIDLIRAECQTYVTACEWEQTQFRLDLYKERQPF